MQDDLCYLSIGEASRLIRRRELSPLELTRACLERIRRLDGTLNAFITVTGESALAAAREAEAAIARGEYRGALHGIPIAIKDIFATQGVRTTAGSRILADWVPEHDATVVARLRATGAVFLGKVNLHEFAYGVTNVNPHYGPTRNPWDTERIPGGSSGGSGAAVAAGLCLGAIGSDTGGSIRIPSSLCGIVGLKPTYGRVSRHGVVPLSWSLDHVGPMTRTVEDAALMLSAMAGHDAQDAASASEPVPDYPAALMGDIHGLRVGIPRAHFFEGVDDAVLVCVEEAIRTLGEIGAKVEEISIPSVAQASAAASAILWSEATTYHYLNLKSRPQDYGDDVRVRLEAGLGYLALHYIQAQRVRSLFRQELTGIFQEVDVLATPTTPTAALKIGEAPADRARSSLTRFTSPFNLAGLPALSVPCGFTLEGLPVGLQIVGRAFDEVTVLRAGHAYQQHTDWHKRRPPV